MSLKNGIIPALAGNTVSMVSSSRATWDHPRACGEHPYRLHVVVGLRGSSPRLRGTRQGRHRQNHRHGIIPALAGNTPGKNGRAAARRDHPRACGEHPRKLSLMTDKQGSSPRLRGTPVAQSNDVDCGGIIPALAGNTCWPSPTGRSNKDHPRACGEHDVVTNSFWDPLGSSPRLRGTHMT